MFIQYRMVFVTQWSKYVWRAILLALSVSSSVALAAYPPEHFTYPSSDSTGSVPLSWSAAATGAYDTYEIHVNKNGTGWNYYTDTSETSTIASGLTNGSYVFRIRTCPIDSGCSPFKVGSNTLVVSLQNPTANISANPQNIAANGSSTITWSSNHAVSCSLNGVGVGLSGSQTHYNMVNSTNYTIACANGLGSTQQTTTVNVIPPPGISGEYANPNPVARGQATSIHWNVTNASSCTVNGIAAWSPYQTPAVHSDQNFTIACNGVGGTTSKVVFVAAPPPASIAYFTATSNPIETGTNVKLNWSTANATSCLLNGAGVPTAATDYSVGPLYGNTNYTLACSGVSGGDSKALQIIVAPRTVLNSFSADANPISAGQSTIIRWNVSNANSCTLNGASVSAVGNVSTGTLSSSTSYRLLCQGTVNNIDTTLTVTVHPAPNISQFVAAQNPIAIGSSTTMQWSTSNTNSCSIDGVSVATNGTKSTGTLSASKTFRLTCVGTSSASTYKDLTVTATVAPVATLSSTFTHVEQGSGTTITWTSANASSCTLDGVAVALNGSQSTGNLSASKTYTLNCTSQVGSVEKQTTVNVVAVGTLWRDIGQCDPRTGKKQQRCGDARGCVVNETRSVNGGCATSSDCQQ